MAGTVMPYVKMQFFDNNGLPAVGYKLFTYSAGTTNKLATFSDVGLLTPNTNPIVLDASGRCLVYLSASSYKFVMAPPTDTDPPTVPIWTVDDVTAVPGSNTYLDLTGIAGESLAAVDAVYLSDGSGGQTAGQWYKADASDAYSSTTAACLGMVPVAITVGASGSVRIIGKVTGLSALTPGSTYYVDTAAGLVTITPPTNARPIGIADTATSIIMSEWLPVSLPVATAAVAGIVSVSAQSFGGLKTFTAGLQSDIPLTFKAPGGSTYLGALGTLNSQFATVGNVGAGEDTLMTYTMPAATLATNGQAVKVLAWGKTASNANAKTLKAYFGATQVLGGSGAVLATSEAGHWLCGFVVMRSAATTQRATAQAVCGPEATQVTVCVGGVSQPAETLANAVVIKLTGTATADNDITQEGMLITVAS